MGKIVVGLVGLLIAVVIAVALMPDLIDNIDVLDDTVGPDGECRVIGNRYVAVLSGSGDDRWAQVSLAATPQVGDARLAQKWRLGEYIADSDYRGVPQATECSRDTNTLDIQEHSGDTSFRIPPGTAVEPWATVEARVSGLNYVAPLGDPVFFQDAPLSPTKLTRISDYVAIAYEEGEAREYGGVMTAIIRLLPLLLILAIFVFIIVRVGIERIPGLRRIGGRRRR